MGDHASVAGLYRPLLVLNGLCPFQTIISSPVQTEDPARLDSGAFSSGEMGSHESEAGRYRPPVVMEYWPPQTSISEPVQWAMCPRLGEGAPTGERAAHVCKSGS